MESIGVDVTVEPGRILEQLEEKVQAHNRLIERTYKLEGRMTEAEHDIRDLKEATHA